MHFFPDIPEKFKFGLLKVIENDWQGAIFAYAGLERIGLLPDNRLDLDWMVPAPAQGAVMVMGRSNNQDLKQWVSEINHSPTAICTQIEREFLRTLEGGCTAPIGALASLSTDGIQFTGLLNSLDGSQELRVEEEVALDEVKDLGVRLAKELLDNGGKKLMESIRQSQGR